MKVNHVFLKAAAVGMLALGMGLPMAAAQSGAPKTAEKAGEVAKVASKDVIIFKNGNRVECEIVEETDTTVKVKVSIAGMSAETVYQKSEILAIQKGAGAPLDGSAPATTKPTDVRKPAAKQDTKHEEGAPTVYVVKCDGEFGRDVSATPMKAVIADARKHQPDILIFEFDHKYSMYGQEKEREYLWIDPDQYNLLETARQIATIVSDQIRDDPEWTKKPRIVGYVKKALGGSAFLPFVCPELYFHDDALLGGIGGLDLKFGTTGDEVVREKLRGANLKRAEGLAEKGGHDPRIIRAMSRIDYVLSYKMLGGKAEFLERMPESADEFLLTDNGQGENRDSLEDLVRYKGNDALTLDARTAERIGFSKGTVSDLRALMLAMGIVRDYVVIDGASAGIFKRWSEEVTKAERDVQRLINDFQRVEVRAPGQYRERTAARTQQKSILRQLRGIVQRYKEALNPRRIGAPAEFITDIDIMIDRIDQAQRLDGPP
jgi:hypothetical protein